MVPYQLISVEYEQIWIEALSRCGSFDIYHLPGYHKLNQDGLSYLLFFETQAGCAALPFVLRDIPNMVAADGQSVYRDITSVYGYPGIVCSLSQNDEQVESFRREFQRTLGQLFYDLNVVTFFTRTNPFISTHWLLCGMAEVTPVGITIQINLSQDPKMQVASMSKGHRYDIRKARKLGVTVREDALLEHLDVFMDMYESTMCRNNALGKYYFPREYYLNLKENLGESCKLFLAELDGHIISAAFFLLSDKIIHYHLSATASQYLQHAGAKLILEEVREWGTHQRFTYLQLGGGVGVKEDSLLRFKRGFSKVGHSFEVVKIICNPEVYQKLIEKYNNSTSDKQAGSKCEGYFPLYRIHS